MQINTKSFLFLLLVFICAATILPFLGMTDFHTKGEPREAIVAVSMLNTDNWILPINNGSDIAYKPPMFHWSIAALSLPLGHINEYTSRLPSALALIIMTLGCFLFYQKRIGGGVAFLSSLLLISTFEVHRAGMAARVDMVLTAYIVLALLQFYKWYEHHLKGVPLWAILFMSAATLTKGPVGIILPCAVAGVFTLIKGEKFFRVVYKFGIASLSACILPALWYCAAYQQGGDQFLSLVLEENFGRFLGKMSYESHEQPIIYNFYITLAGFIPWTILVLISLFAFHYKMPDGTARNWVKKLKDYIRNMNDARLYSLLSIVIIFAFYCIPKSKRSVYLLPIYPFICFFLAEYMIYLLRNKQRVWHIFGTFLSILFSVALLLLAVVRCGWIPDNLPEKSMRLYIDEIADIPLSFWNIFYFILPIFALFFIFRHRKEIALNNRYMYSVIALFFFFQSTLDAVVLPAILNKKSMKPFAMEIIDKVPEGRIYSYVAEPMLHFFVVNFYANDRVIDFEREHPQEGYLLVGKNDFKHIDERYGDLYTFVPELVSSQKGNDIRDIIYLYRFSRKE